MGLNKTLYVKCLALHLAHRKLPQVVAVVTTINMYSRQNNDPPPPQKMSLETVNILCYMVKRMKVADRIKVANQLTLKWEDYPGLAPYVITRVLPGRERGRRVRTREMAAWKDLAQRCWLWRWKKTTSQGMSAARDVAKAGRGKE